MSGLHFDSIADLPDGVRAKVAVKVFARRVAAEVSVEDQIRRKKDRRLETLRDAALEGAISDLRVNHHIVLRENYLTQEGEYVRQITHVADFTYKVNLPLDHWPCCCDVHDVEFWQGVANTSGTGTMVIENIADISPGFRGYGMKKDLMAEKGYILREV